MMFFLVYAVSWITRQIRACMVRDLRGFMLRSIQFSTVADLMICLNSYVRNEQHFVGLRGTSEILMSLTVFKALYTPYRFGLSRITTWQKCDVIFDCNSSAEVLCHTKKHSQIADGTALWAKIARDQSTTVSEIQDDCNMLWLLLWPMFTNQPIEMQWDIMCRSMYSLGYRKTSIQWRWGCNSAGIIIA